MILYNKATISSRSKHRQLVILHPTDEISSGCMKGHGVLADSGLNLYTTGFPIHSSSFSAPLSAGTWLALISDGQRGVHGSVSFAKSAPGSCLSIVLGHHRMWRRVPPGPASVPWAHY